MIEYAIYAVLALLVMFLTLAIRILREYERGVVFTLGRFTAVKGPGLIILIPVVQQLVKVDLRGGGRGGPPRGGGARGGGPGGGGAGRGGRSGEPERAGGK